MSSTEIHPLVKNPAWLHSQPWVGTSLPLWVDKEEVRVKTRSTCREAVVTKVREILQAYCTTIKAIGDSSWQKERVLTRTPLCLDRNLARSQTALSYIWRGGFHLPDKNGTPATTPTPTIEQFILIADAICGNTMVLLDPVSNPSSVYHTKFEGFYEESYIPYKGFGAWALQHPALLAIGLGLLRQAMLLQRAGVGDQILSSVDRSKIVEALTQRDRTLAFENLTKVLPWVCVPPAKGDGSNGNTTDPQPNYVYFPFPQGYEGRLMKLVAACGRSKGAVFGENMITNWKLLEGSQVPLGIWGWLGTKEAKPNAEAERIERLASQD